MEYEIITTNIFDDWFAGIKDIRSKARIITRFDRVKMGNLGDYKNIGGGLYEMRFFFGPGFRVYFTLQHTRIIILLCGGDKSKQQKDIATAKTVLGKLQEHEYESNNE
jgi:putative addiction module killer protein